MIKPIRSDIGRCVINCEPKSVLRFGTLTAFNTKYGFVQYNGTRGSVAVKLEHLIWDEGDEEIAA